MLTTEVFVAPVYQETKKVLLVMWWFCAGNVLVRCWCWGRPHVLRATWPSCHRCWTRPTRVGWGRECPLRWHRSHEWRALSPAKPWQSRVVCRWPPCEERSVRTHHIHKMHKMDLQNKLTFEEDLLVFDGYEFITTAKFPIITFRFGEIPIDIQFNNFIAVNLPKSRKLIPLFISWMKPYLHYTHPTCRQTDIVWHFGRDNSSGDEGPKRTGR